MAKGGILKVKIPPLDPKDSWLGPEYLKRHSKEKTIEVLKNASQDEVKRWAGRDIKSLRMTIDHEGNVYVWDGREAIHEPVHRGLGLTHPGDEFSDTPIHPDNYNYWLRQILDDPESFGRKVPLQTPEPPPEVPFVTKPQRDYDEYAEGGPVDTQLDDLVGAIRAGQNEASTHHAPVPYRDPQLGNRFWTSLMTQWQGLDDKTGDVASMLDLTPTEPRVTEEPAFRRHRGAGPLITATGEFHEPVLTLGIRTLPEQLKATFKGDFLGENASPELQRLNKIEERVQERAGLDAPQGLAENLASTAGMLAGQLPLPGDLMAQGVSKLPTAARAALKVPAAVADFFGPTFHPSLKNLASGSAAGLGIQEGMDAWIRHQQALRDEKWGPLQQSVDYYHADLFRRAREGKITRQEAEYLLKLLDTSDSGEDILEAPSEDEVPPVTVKKAKGGKIKPPTMTKLGLRQKLVDLMSDANVEGTGKEMVPLPDLNPEATTATMLPTSQDEPLTIEKLREMAGEAPAPPKTPLLETPVSRRDVLKGMRDTAVSLVSPVKLDPLSMMTHEFDPTGLGRQELHGAIESAAGPKPYSPHKHEAWYDLYLDLSENEDGLDAILGRTKGKGALQWLQKHYPMLKGVDWMAPELEELNRKYPAGEIPAHLEDDPATIQTYQKDWTDFWERFMDQAREDIGSRGDKMVDLDEGGPEAPNQAEQDAFSQRVQSFHRRFHTSDESKPHSAKSRAFIEETLGPDAEKYLAARNAVGLANKSQDLLEAKLKQMGLDINEDWKQVPTGLRKRWRRIRKLRDKAFDDYWENHSKLRERFTGPAPEDLRWSDIPEE